MAINMIASGSQINLRSVLNSKLESGVLQTELNLTAPAALTGQAVRFDEYNTEHDNSTGKHDAGFLIDSYVSSSAAITATKLAIHRNYNKTVTVTSSATANTNGSSIDLSPATGYSMIMPRAMDITLGGTFNTGSLENVTVTITATYSDTTTKAITVSNNAAGIISLTNTQIMSLIPDGLFINKLSLASKSSIATTATTVSVNHCGFYL